MLGVRRSANRGLWAGVLFGLFAMVGVICYLTKEGQVAPDGGSSLAADAGGLVAIHGGLSGWLIDGHLEQPISSARVRVECEAGVERQTSSDSAGEFSFDDLPAGPCIVRADAEGFLAGGRQTQAKMEIDIEAGLRLTDLKVVLFKAAQVSGRVLSGQTPVGGARMSALYLEAPGETGAFSVDLPTESLADGSYHAMGLGPGRVLLMAEVDGYALAESAEVFLRSGAQVQGLDIQLSADATLSGQVVDPKGGPLVGAQVRLFAAGSKHPRSAVSGPDGRFSFDQVASGEYRLSARMPGHRSAHPLTGRLKAGELSERKIVLEALLGLVGEVVDSEGRPVPGAAVFALDAAAKESEPEIQTRADQFGAFHLPGPYKASKLIVWATHPSFGSSEEIVADTSSDAKLLLRMGAPGRLVGRVVSAADGQAIKHFQVVAFGQTVGPESRRSVAGYAFRTVHNAAGRFSLERIAPGNYLVEVQAAGFTTARKPGLRVGKGRTTEAGTIYLDAGATLVGRVEDSDGHSPLARVQVRTGIMGRASVRTLTGADGAFRLQGVPAERLSVSFFLSGYDTEVISGISAPSGGDHDMGTIRLARSEPGDKGSMNYAGMGAQVKMEADGTISIGEIFDGAPAAAAGLVTGARILRIDGLDVRDMGLRRAVELIRGEAGTELSLDAILPGRHHPQTILVERNQIRSH